jgi:hypothetical protein
MGMRDWYYVNSRGNSPRECALLVVIDPSQDEYIAMYGQQSPASVNREGRNAVSGKGAFAPVAAVENVIHRFFFHN